MDLAEPPQEVYTWELPDLIDKTSWVEVNALEHLDEEEHHQTEKRVTEVRKWELFSVCMLIDGVQGWLSGSFSDDDEQELWDVLGSNPALHPWMNDLKKKCCHWPHIVCV